MVDKGRTERRTYVLKGRQEHEILLEDEHSWSIEKDPTSIRTGILVADGLSLRLENRAPGLRVVFLEVGGDGLFSNRARNDTQEDDELIDFGETLRKKAHRILLPGQGFQLIFVRKPMDDQ